MYFRKTEVIVHAVYLALWVYICSFFVFSHALAVAVW